MRPLFRRGVLAVCAAALVSLLPASGQERPPQQPQIPQVTSPEVMQDGKIAFRLYAPKAETVGLMAGDIPGQARGGPQFVKAENGVWETAIGPVKPGAYRYRFVVNGVAVMDPRNAATSESNTNAWSLVVVPGEAFMDAARVPHGAVAAVHYYSTSLNRHRRMHVYTPPGYEAGKGKFPVFYLLHGAGDCDHSWSTVGRAGFILDNLIAAGKAKPMIVVMPAGHTSAQFGGARGLTSALDEFGQDFMKDIVPYVEANYRVLDGRQNRAIAGLSMGGAQTLNISMSNLEKFAYIGVFSSGVFGAPRPPATPAAPGAAPAAPGMPGPSPEWEQQRAATLDNPALKKGLKLVWFATGSEDFLLKTTQQTVEMLKKRNFDVVYKETDGGHTWIKWRDYLNEFAPKLF